MSQSLLLSAIVLTVTLTAGASASADQPPTRLVKTAGLDLATATGQRIATRRILAAAATVCEQYDSRDMMKQRLFKRCNANAVIGAQRQLSLLIARATNREKGERLASER